MRIVVAIVLTSVVPGVGGDAGCQADDGISVEISTIDDASDDVKIRWTGGGIPYALYRAGVARWVSEPAHRMTTTFGTDWTDPIFGPFAGEAYFYLVLSTCGDGMVGPGEQCDDRNKLDGDCCSSTCTRTGWVCGDGVVDAQCETCDPPGDPVGRYRNLCRADCTYCGDDIVQETEDCDSIDVCDETCQFLFFFGCTAGRPQPPSGNPCYDDEESWCGDGFVNGPENCDDGNSINGDGCDNNCTNSGSPLCGNGVIDPGEECDDGNNAAGDGCRPACTVEVCGDSILDLNEDCDPPGNPPGGPDECPGDCRF